MSHVAETASAVPHSPQGGAGVQRRSLGFSPRAVDEPTACPIFRPPPAIIADITCGQWSRPALRLMRPWRLPPGMGPAALLARPVRRARGIAGPAPG